MQTFYRICLGLLIAGGINWGLVGMFQFDLAGWLLGGSIGFGTLIHLVATGPIIDLVFRLLRFDPRSVQHEGLVQTFRAFSRAHTAA